MIAASILAWAEGASIALSVQGEAVVVKSTHGRIPPALIRAIQAHKPAILPLLRQREAGSGAINHDEAEARAMAEHYAAPPECAWDDPPTPEEHRRQIEALLRSAGGLRKPLGMA